MLDTTITLKGAMYSTGVSEKRQREVRTSEAVEGYTKLILPKLEKPTRRIPATDEAKVMALASITQESPVPADKLAEVYDT